MSVRRFEGQSLTEYADPEFSLHAGFYSQIAVW